MKIAVLWTHLSGYLNACLRELAKINDVQILVSNFVSTTDAPFYNEQFSWIKDRYEWQNHIDKIFLKNLLIEYQPDVFLVSSWHIPEYRYILKKFSGTAIRILAMDNPWLGTIKQWLGVFSSKLYLHPFYDAVFLPGERQMQFAKKLGFPENRILRGLYCCDHEKFANIYMKGKLSYNEFPSTFMYVGRLASEKGIMILRYGYEYYRSSVEDPWPLICYGTGPLEYILKDVDGIIIKGFVQPRDLPQAMENVSCLLLPSLYEPWGVVVHEATTAGLAIICSSACGSSVHLVQDGYNGYIVSPNDPMGLGNAMIRYTKLNQKRKKEMSRNSYSMSLQFIPQRWAIYFYEHVLDLLT